MTPEQMRATITLLGWECNGFSYFKRCEGLVGWVVVKPEYAAGIVFARYLVTLNYPGQTYGLHPDNFGDRQLEVVYHKIMAHEHQWRWLDGA